MTSMFTASPSLDPNAAQPSSDPTPVDLAVLPSMSDTEIVGRVRELFSRARSERKPTLQQWIRNYRILRNRTWGSNRLSWMPQPEVPEARSTVAACVAWLTDQRPEFDLGAVAAPYSEYAGYFEQLGSDMKTAIDAGFQTYCYESEIETACWDAYTYDIGILKTTWDPTLAGGLGDVRLQRIDPVTWYPDPAATNKNNMNYCIEARTISLQELDRRFPGAAEKFNLQGYQENVDEIPNFRRGMGRTPMANPGAIAPATSAQYGLPGQSRESVSRDDTGVTLLECWLREHSYEEREDDQPPKVYECWRNICVAGQYVLSNRRADEMYPFPDHPYDVFRPEEIGEFYGQSMVELLTPSQLSINHALASIEQVVDLAGNPPFKESSRSGMQRTKINPSQPGARVTVAAGDSESGWMAPPSNNISNLELVNWHIEAMGRTSGLDAINKGSLGTGRVASDVYDAAQEAGFVRLRLAQRNLEFALRSIGQKYAAFVAEFYLEPRFLELVGPAGEQSFKMLSGRHFFVPGKPGDDGKGTELPLRFKVSVRAGSMLPTSRNARIAEIDTLFAMSAVDRAVVLEAHNVPNRQAILERMAETDAKGTTMQPGARQRSQR